MGENPFRILPSVDELARWLRAACPELSIHSSITLASMAVEECRTDLRSGVSVGPDEIRGRALNTATALLRPRLVPAINATGVILHTNLGRSPVSNATAAAMASAAAGYVPLEIEPETNDRGGRMREISDLLRLLTGAERTVAVNNNAAAILLTLTALTAGREVVVSRGEAVEIGGGFRVPDVLRQSGARLVEVGTTNRTYLSDFETAMGPDTAAILKVHASNFVISGFTAAVTAANLAELARRAGILAIEDVGSGALLQPADFGLAHEPTLADSIRAGVDVVTASGDKLLGGPQAGIVVGKAALIERIERHPLARAVRADKTALAGVAATLRHYVRGEPTTEIPVWRMIAATLGSLRQRAEALSRMAAGSGIGVGFVETLATVGGGSLPGQELPSFALALPPVRSPDELASCLRTGEVSVFGRIDNGKVLLDLRTVLPEQDEPLSSAVERAFSGPA